MHVLHITPSLFCPASGLAVAVRGTASGLRAAGVDVTVASLREDDVDEDADFTCFLAERSRCPGLATWGYSSQLRKQIEAAFAVPPDIVHAHGLWLYPQELARTLAARWRRPLVVSVHGMLEPWAHGHHGWRKRVVWMFSTRRTVATARALIATSEQEAGHLRTLNTRYPVVVIPLAVSVPKWVQARSDGGPVGRLGDKAVGLSGALTARLPDRPTGQRTALFLSRMHPSKGLLLLVEAVARVRPRGWRFVVAGPDENGHTAAVRRKARHAGVMDWFEFRGAVHGDDKWRLYQSADMFVLPSYNENFGLVVAEALAAGLPIVTTTSTPWGEVRSRNCGWICEPTVAGLAAALAEACACPDEVLVRMGAAGAAWVRQAFAPEENARRHLELYERLRMTEAVELRTSRISRIGMQKRLT